MCNNNIRSARTIVLGLLRVLSGVIANIVDVRWSRPEGERRRLLDGQLVNGEVGVGGRMPIYYYLYYYYFYIIIIHLAARVGFPKVYRVMGESEAFIILYYILATRKTWKDTCTSP